MKYLTIIVSSVTDSVILQASACSLFSLLLYLAFINGHPLGIATDQNQYILLSRSLLSGNGYREIWLIDNLFHTKFPFIYPFLLAPIIYFFDYNFLLFRVLLCLFLSGTIFILYIWFRRFTDTVTTLALTALTAFSSVIFFSVHQLFAEIPYLFFSVSAIFFIEKYNDSNNVLNRYLALSAAFALLAYFTRNVGISLIGAAFAYILFKNNGSSLRLHLSKFLCLAVLTLTPIALWSLRSYGLNKMAGFDYIQYFASMPNPFDGTHLSLIQIVARTSYAFICYTFPKIITGIQFQGFNVFALLLSLFTIGGFIRQVTRKISFQDIYFVFFMSILLLWADSMVSGPRFILPVVPFIFYYIIVAGKYLLNLLPTPRAGLVIAYCALFLLFAVNIISLASTIQKSTIISKNDIDFLSVASWIRGNTHKSALVFGIDPSTTYLYSERKSVAIPALTDEQPENKFIEDHNIDYIIVKENDNYPSRYPDKYSEVYKTGGYLLYKVIERHDFK